MDNVTEHPAFEAEETPVDGMDGLDMVESIAQELDQGLAAAEGNDAENADSTQPPTQEATAAEEQDRWVEPMEVEKRMTYIDYLKSPVIHIMVGQSPRETILSAHLALLQKSQWFAEACSSYSNSTPHDERIVKLPDEDLGAVGSFLEYLYVGEYTPRLLPGASGKAEDQVLEHTDDSQVDEAGDNLLRHAKVYTLAEKLQLPELKHLAHSKIHRINSTAKGELRYAKFVYENTSKDDETIRQPIASFWAHRSHVLRHEAEAEFKAMILEFPHFAFDILSIVLDQKEKGREKDKDHHSKSAKATAGGPADDGDGPITATKTPRTSRKRLRMSVV